MEDKVDLGGITTQNMNLIYYPQWEKRRGDEQGQQEAD